MSTDVEAPPEQTVASLMCGILSDLQTLVEQQFQLTRREIEDELRQRASAAAVFVLGSGVLLVDAIALSLTLAHWMHWMASPPGTDPAWLPLWACHAVMTGVLALIGAILVQMGRARFRSVAPCQNPATEILQEHVS
jgi:hypothetical protein